jgi:hypothetical protein
MPVSHVPSPEPYRGAGRPFCLVVLSSMRYHGELDLLHLWHGRRSSRRLVCGARGSRWKATRCITRSTVRVKCPCLTLEDDCRKTAESRSCARDFRRATGREILDTEQFTNCKLPVKNRLPRWRCVERRMIRAMRSGKKERDYEEQQKS